MSAAPETYRIPSVRVCVFGLNGLGLKLPKSIVILLAL